VSVQVQAPLLVVLVQAQGLAQAPLVVPEQALGQVPEQE
jgi:hypothetical protein